MYAFQNVFDSTFYGLGKTNYMLFKSIIINCVYYGAAFALYLAKIWVPTLTGIALLLVLVLRLIVWLLWVHTYFY